MKISLFIKILLLAVLVAAAFSPCLRAGYLNWDDPAHVLENVHVNSLSPANLKAMFTARTLNVFIPLTTLSHALERKLFGKSPAVPHTVNVLLHIGVTLAVFFLCLRLGLSELAAFLAALLFGLHPVHVESVAWITERKDVLFGLFYILALYHYLEYAGRNNDPERGTVDGGRGTKDVTSPSSSPSHVNTKKASYVWAFLFGTLSILAKPMAVSLPWVLFLMDWLAGRRMTARLFWDKVPFLVLIGLVALLTYIPHVRDIGLVLQSSILIGIWTATFYVRIFFFPVGLGPVPLLPQPISILNPEYSMAVLLAVILALSLWLLRKERWVVFAIVFYAATMFFLWRLDRRDVDIVAERFLYVPSLGFCILTGFYLEQGLKALKTPWMRQGGMVMTALLLGALAVKTFLQCGLWNDDLTLWKDVIKRVPRHAVAHERIAFYYYEQGEYDKALQYSQKALEIDPRYAGAQYTAGVIDMTMGRYEDAVSRFNRAIAIVPDLSNAYAARGKCRMFLGQEEEALADLDHAIRLNPDYVGARNDRANVLMKQGAWKEALNEYNKVLALDPQYLIALSNRGNLYRNQGMPEKALTDYNNALKIAPRDAVALEQSADIYVQQGKFHEARERYNVLVAQEPSQGRFFYGRAVVYEHLGRTDLALQDALKARDLGVPVAGEYVERLKALGSRQ